MNKVLIVSHIIFRLSPPYDPLEGPYSSVYQSIQKIGWQAEYLGLPIDNYKIGYCYGKWPKFKKGKLPSIIRNFSGFIKYVFDFFFVFFFAWYWLAKNKKYYLTIIGIDPLSGMSLILLKNFFKFKLIFYSVDFNRQRFKNKLLQWIYEKADKVSSINSDQIWVVCESLKKYKSDHYFKVNPIYIPNSSIFDFSIYKNNYQKKNGNRLVWTGSLLTEKQFDILFGLLKEISKLRPEMEFYFAPTGQKDKFRNSIKKYQLRNSLVVDLHSRREWQEFAAGCDLGIAVYDPDFGSTEFIEPLKIWDFMLGGLPFIISSEPSLSKAVASSGVAYVLGKRNKIIDKNSLSNFIKPSNIKKIEEKCLALAKEYAIDRQIKKVLKML